MLYKKLEMIFFYNVDKYLSCFWIWICNFFFFLVFGIFYVYLRIKVWFFRFYVVIILGVFLGFVLFVRFDREMVVKVY